jgi:hypothetical protein
VNRLGQQEARQPQMISSPPEKDSALVAAVLRKDRKKQQQNLSPSTLAIFTGTSSPAWPRCTTKWKILRALRVGLGSAVGKA